MFKGMLVLFWQYLKSKQRRGLLAVLMIFMSVVMVHCVSRTKHPVVLGPAILYQGSHLVIPENSALRSAIRVEPVHLQTIVTNVIVPATIQAIPANMVSVLPP
ncbi:MAG: hypothetical protein NTZ86_02595, partial [Legionellales bacterium]|nr:hypothetical protein [Legionellales bacterium]